MSEYLDLFNKHFNIRISLYVFIIASVVSLIGFWIYPNFIFHYGLISMFIIFAFATPILIIWKLYNISNGLRIKFLHVLISIWIGLFFTFITSHQLITRLGDIEWRKAALRTEMYLDYFYSYNGYYPENLGVVLDAFPEKNSFILERHINLITIFLTDKLNDGYELRTGFWIADFRTWDTSSKKWIYSF